MEAWLTTLFSCTLTTGLITLILLALLPVLSRRYKKGTLYLLLVICMVSFLIPWRPRLITQAPAVSMPILPAKTVSARDLPAYTARPADLPLMTGAVRTTAQPVRETQPARPSAPDLALLLTALWASGAAAVLIYGIFGYVRIRRLLRRWREPPNAHTLDLYAETARAAGVGRLPALYVCPAVVSPLAAGLIRPVICLPADKYRDEDLRLILKHELVHVARGDLYVKWLTLFACALHWMDPVCWLLRGALNEYAEISCDERVMNGADGDERIRYSETIIAAIRPERVRSFGLTTGFEGGLKRMKRRIKSIMDNSTKRLGMALAALAIALTLVAGSAANLSIRAEEKTLPGLPDNYRDEPDEHFDAGYPAWTGGGAYGSAPVYNGPDDPGWPAAIYAPGLPIVITGRKWRQEHLPGVTGDGSMVWLECEITTGEGISGAWIPDRFVAWDDPGKVDLPEAELSGEGSFVGLYAHITDASPADTLEKGTVVGVISCQPGWWQVAVGNKTGYIREGELRAAAPVYAAFHPDYADGYDRWRLGYLNYYDQYYSWFEGMSARYGSHDFWDNELKALDTRMKIEYGLIEKGDTAFYIPEADDLTGEEALKLARGLVGDDGSADENGVPRYAWQVYFRADYEESDEPYWWVRGWASKKNDEDVLVTLDRRTGAQRGEIGRFPNMSDRAYNEIALCILYGEQRYLWPMAVREAQFPEEYPALAPGQPDENEIIGIALTALENAYGAERRLEVEQKFSMYADRQRRTVTLDETAREYVLWTVRFINMAPGQVEQITAQFDADGAQYGAFIDEFYGEPENFAPEGNG